MAPTIEVNGERREITEGETVATLLERLGIGAHPCAVEVNRMLVRKRDHADATLLPGDRVEIVTLVGGG